MKKFSNQKFDCIQGVNHMGYAIVFACQSNADDTGYRYYYRVLDLDEVDEQTPIDEDHWIESKELLIPDGYRSLGMNLINIETNVSLEATSPEFTVITDDSYIYLLRVSANNTLYLNRFTLSIADYSINPAWETRYRRSSSTDYPKNKKDTFGYKDMDDKIFFEPTFELTNISTPSNLQPAIFFTEDFIAEKKLWNIVAIAPDQRSLNFYSIPCGRNGLPDLARKELDPQGNISPDQTLHLKDYQIRNSISSLLFSRQEKVSEEDKDKLQRTIRVMLSFPLYKEQEGNLAVLDVAVAKNGSLAEIPEGEIELQILNSPGSMPAIFTDSRELNCCGAILDYIKTEKRVFLLKSSDGDIYLYAKSDNGQPGTSLPNFVYSIYATETTRNIFSIATTDGDTSLKAISTRSGSQMNNASLSVQLNSDNSTCSTQITNNEKTEQWQSLPIDLTAIESILNGNASDNIFSPTLKNQQQIFFDYNNKWELNAVPSSDASGNPAGLHLIIRSIPKAISTDHMTGTITPGSSPELCNLHLSMPFAGIEISEAWADLPKETDKFQQAINGLSRAYNYAEKSEINNAICRLTAGAFFIWLISKDTSSPQGNVEIEKVSISKCTITLKSVLADNSVHYEIWPDVSREPDKLVATLSGQQQEYDYSKVQRNFQNSGDPSALFIAANTGGSEPVNAQQATGVKPLKGGSILAVSTHYGSGTIENTFSQLEQSAISDVPLSHSMIFNFSTLSNKSDIEGINVTDQITHEGIGQDAIWLTPPKRTSLQFNHSAVAIDAQKNLDIEQSLTLEVWIHPQKSGEDLVRIIHHSSDTTTSQYALGLERVSGMNEYAVYGAVRESAAKTFDFPVIEDTWNHVAFSYGTGFSLEFEGVNYIDCGDSSSLDPGDALTIEAWVKPQSQSAEKRLIASKSSPILQDKSYQIFLEGDNAILKFYSSSQHKEYTCSQKLPDNQNQWLHIAAVISFEAVSETTTTGEAVTNTNIKGALFVNGSADNPVMEKIEGEILQLNVSPSIFTIGGEKDKNATYSDALHRISEVRIWNRILPPEEIAGNYTEKRITGTTDNLISFWALNEGEGRTANDQTKLNKGMITSSNLWRFSRQGASWNFFVNGVPSDIVLMDSTEVGGFYENKTYIGAMGYEQYVWQAVIGELDEIRIWDRSITQEEALDSMYAELDGQERGLQGYWQCDLGTGKQVPDKSNHGNDGTFCPIAFDSLSASLTLENEEKLGINLQLDNCELGQISFAPVDGAFQFDLITSDTSTLTPYWLVSSGYSLSIQQNDGEKIGLTTETPISLIANTDLNIKIFVDGSTVTSLKALSRNPQEPVWNSDTVAPVERDLPCCRVIPSNRTYPQNVDILNTSCAIEYGETQIDANGELQGIMKRCQAFIATDGTVYLQNGFKVGETSLKYIGQVQTKPTLIGYIEGPPPVPSENLTINDNKTDDYAGTSSIQIHESNSSAYHYSGSSDTYLDMSLDTKFGLYYGTETKAGVGVSQEVFKLEGKLGIHLKGESSLGWKSSIEEGASTTINTKNSLDCCGFWEVKKDYDNSGTLRYLNPEVGQRYLPNNMGYALVKSGTADLFSMCMRSTGATVNYVIRPNPNIPEDWNIIMFPLNPYYVKNGSLDGMVGLVPDPDYPAAINGELGSYFDPIEAYALKESIDQEKEDLKTFFNQISTTPHDAMQAITPPDNALLRNWDEKISSRNIANTYVWTAQGGLYAEEELYQDVKKISHGGIYTISLQLGIYGSLSLRGGAVGIDVEADILFGPRWETSIVSSEENASSFGMTSSVSGEGWLNKWNKETEKYEEFDCPGKVDTYRFMSYYLSPTTSNFDTFFNDVVDPAWLNNSNVPNAIALKQAEQTENSVWRILHRVTFISRVPPEYKSSPDESPTPTATRPINIAFNQWLIDLLNKHLSQPHPERAAIDTAVDTVLDTDLPALNTYWRDFIAKAHDTPDGDEARQLLDIRNRSKRYFYDYYTTT